MGPEVVAVVCIVGVVLVLAFAVGLFLLGQNSRAALVDALEAEISRLEAALNDERRRSRERADGARSDLDRDRSVTTSDLGGLLQHFAAEGDGAPPGEPGDEADGV